MVEMVTKLKVIGVVFGYETNTSESVNLRIMIKTLCLFGASVLVSNFFF